MRTHTHTHTHTHTYHHVQSVVPSYLMVLCWLDHGETETTLNYVQPLRGQRGHAEVFNDAAGSFNHALNTRQIQESVLDDELKSYNDKLFRT